MDFTDFDEFQATSDPTKEDTDGDAIPDGIEAPGGAWQVEGRRGRNESGQSRTARPATLQPFRWMLCNER